MTRRCVVCGVSLPEKSRSDRRTCSARCRVALSRRLKETAARSCFYALVAAIEAEARAPLLAELRAQAFGEPRCVPLSIIERIFAALEEPTP